MSDGHPSDQDLIRWTTSGRGRRAEQHAQHCAFCEQRLEALTELAPETARRLAAALTPSNTFLDRLTEHVHRRLLNQETLAVLTDLVEVGPETSGLLIRARQDEPARDETRDEEDGHG